ncbi:MAG TPA: DUF262 domain-containing protein [Thermoplasmata archaeon]|nr:DUF262 domain-containing protein [Thermoplasmata archaeon]
MPEDDPAQAVSSTSAPWFEDYITDEEGFDVSEFDLTSSPNDFNIATIYSFIEAGSIRVPSFQRNFIWDQKRSSKLIESLILGLPVPQIFLFEKARNTFQVIDGQQRLMSIYYFIKGRFPRREKRVELRRVFDENSRIPEGVLTDDSYFTQFALKLPTTYQLRESPFENLTYETLGDLRNQLDLRPVRIVIIKQSKSDSETSAVYEIFTRLNTGGVNLTPQEIRSCMFESSFYETLTRMNLAPAWRRLLGKPNPDLHLKDVEILLRSFALLIDGSNYGPPMVKFLNEFSKKSENNSPEKNAYISALFESFLNMSRDLPEDAFYNLSTHRFGIGLFEACFVASCSRAFSEKGTKVSQLETESIRSLLRDQRFVDASYGATTSQSNVLTRLALAAQYVGWRRGR